MYLQVCDSFSLASHPHFRQSLPVTSKHLCDQRFCALQPLAFQLHGACSPSGRLPGLGQCPKKVARNRLARRETKRDLENRELKFKDTRWRSS